MGGFFVADSFNPTRALIKQRELASQCALVMIVLLVGL